jgi:hypothetical protein
MAFLTTASIMTSCSAAPAALRRVLPFSDGSTDNFTCGRIEIVTLGNQERLISPFFR